eukprot:527831-Rhodomonas_salina.1
MVLSFTPVGGKDNFGVQAVSCATRRHIRYAWYVKRVSARVRRQEWTNKRFEPGYVLFIQIRDFFTVQETRAYPGTRVPLCTRVGIPMGRTEDFLPNLLWGCAIECIPRYFKFKQNPRGVMHHRQLLHHLKLYLDTRVPLSPRSTKPPKTGDPQRVTFQTSKDHAAS